MCAYTCTCIESSFYCLCSRMLSVWLSFLCVCMCLRAYVHSLVNRTGKKESVGNGQQSCASARVHATPENPPCTLEDLDRIRSRQHPPRYSSKFPYAPSNVEPANLAFICATSMVPPARWRRRSCFPNACATSSERPSCHAACMSPIARPSPVPCSPDRDLAWPVERHLDR